MTHNPTVIVGAGLAGLIAAHAWPQARIVERAPEPVAAHRALLRFRTDAVSRLTGIEFRRVTVRKGIWCNGFRPPDIQLANWYAMKCLGRLVGERSIWNVEPAERYIAPDDLYEQLLANVNGRVMWGTDWHSDKLRIPGAGGATVSTAPLSETVQLLEGAPRFDFHRAAITVQRYLLPEDVDLHQTVYFPEPDIALYRASVTGRVLILEYASDVIRQAELTEGRRLALKTFGMDWLGTPPESGVTASQRFGKIAPIDDAARKHALFRLTNEHNIYSLGRFATWRNILLDDVVDDIAVIKRLLRSASSYDLRGALT